MELSVKITATQLTKGMKSFLGQEVRGKESPFCFVPANGDNVRVNEGFWLVEYHDGYREVWSTEQIEANAKPCEPMQSAEVAEDVRIDDEAPDEIIPETPQPEING